MAQERKFETYINLFDERNSATQCKIEGRIRDLEEVDTLSESLIIHILATQRDLWIRARELLPSAMGDLVISSYHQVQHQSVGDAREVRSEESAIYRGANIWSEQILAHFVRELNDKTRANCGSASAETAITVVTADVEKESQSWCSVMWMR